MKSLFSNPSRNGSSNETNGLLPEPMFLRASAGSANEPNGRANSALRAKATDVLQSVLRPEEISHLRIAFHCFPDEWGQDHTGVPIDKLYRDLVQRGLGSAMALILLAPIVLIDALRSSCPRPDRSCTARSGPVSTVCHSRA